MGELPPLSREAHEDHVVRLVTGQALEQGDDPTEQIAFLELDAQPSVQLPQLRDSLLAANDREIARQRSYVDRAYDGDDPEATDGFFFEGITE